MAALGLELLKTYDFKENDISIGGHRLSGFAEDGGVEYDMDSDIGEHVVGADGQVTFSKLNNNVMVVTVTVMETSRAYATLASLMKAQQVAKEVAPLPYLHRDNINGDLVKSKYAVFLNRPNPSKARSAGEREFRIMLPYAADKVSFGPNNVI